MPFIVPIFCTKRTFKMQQNFSQNRPRMQEMTSRFSNFPGGAYPRTPLANSRALLGRFPRFARESLIKFWPPNIENLPTPMPPHDQHLHCSKIVLSTSLVFRGLNKLYPEETQVKSYALSISHADLTGIQIYHQLLPLYTENSTLTQLLNISKWVSALALKQLLFGAKTMKCLVK